MTGVEIGVAVVILVGIVGVLVPVLPGSVLVGGAILVWAITLGEAAGWVVFALAAAFLVLGAVVKYAVPGQRMKADGIPNLTLLLGGVGAVVGFFAIPVVGVPIGFVVGIYLAELQRVGSDRAWPSTTAALRAVGVSILIELGSCTLAAATWAVGVVAT